MPVLSIQIGVGDVVEMGVGPEKFISEIVDGQGVGPGQSVLVGDDACEVAAVEAHAADVGLKVPRGEEEVPNTWMDDDGARVGYAVRFQGASVGPIQFGHFDVLRVAVEPVNLTANPIHGNT